MNTSQQDRSYCLVTSCPDRVGIVAAVSQFVAERGGSLDESNHHSDHDGQRFFMRNVIDANSLSISVEAFREQFTPLAQKLDMKWHIRDSLKPQNVVIFASKASHCLSDLLYRWHSGELNCAIPCVISNHENLRSIVEWYGIPFHYVPVDKDSKAAAFARMSAIVAENNTDTIVLARYMQIIPAELCRDFSGRLINIHHSFLPSFIGANPYQKAFDRGVKLIGATSHYVTEELDEGPIIEQDVIRVSHSCNKDDLVRLGRDVERSVLSKALRYHLEDRVMIQGNKTIVF